MESYVKLFTVLTAILDIWSIQKLFTIHTEAIYGIAFSIGSQNIYVFSCHHRQISEQIKNINFDVVWKNIQETFIDFPVKFLFSSLYQYGSSFWELLNLSSQSETNIHLGDYTGFHYHNKWGACIFFLEDLIMTI